MKVSESLQNFILSKNHNANYLFQESFYSEQTIDATLAGKYKDRADVRLVQIKAVTGQITAHD